MDELIEKNIFKVIDLLFDNNIHLDNITIQKIDLNTDHYSYWIYYCGFWHLRIYENDEVMANITNRDFKSCPSLKTVVLDIKSRARRIKIKNILNSYEINQSNI